MGSIPLSRGLIAIVDDNDVEWLSQWTWSASTTKAPYAVSRLLRDRRSKRISMHRLITNAPDGVLVDHINRNILDNRRSNLRLVTPSQNSQNSGRHSDSKSPYKGVHLNKYGGWVVEIWIGGKNVYLGTFKAAEDGARAYDAAAREHFGEFAHTNFEVQS